MSYTIGNFSYSLGNTKLPKSTIIFNMSSANNCSQKNICPFGVSRKCYALKAERLYPHVLPFRTRQENYWQNTDIETIISDFKTAIKKHKNVPGGKGITAIRFNEAGDFRNMADFRKLNKLAENLNVPVYVYTHNKRVMDKITMKDVSLNLTINISYPNSKKGFNTYCLDTDYKAGQKYILCPGDCKKCNLCLKSKGLKLAVKLH